MTRVDGCEREGNAVGREANVGTGEATVDESKADSSGIREDVGARGEINDNKVVVNVKGSHEEVKAAGDDVFGSLMRIPSLLIDSDKGHSNIDINIVNTEDSNEIPEYSEYSSERFPLLENRSFSKVSATVLISLDEEVQNTCKETSKFPISREAQQMELSFLHPFIGRKQQKLDSRSCFPHDLKSLRRSNCIESNLLPSSATSSLTQNSEFHTLRVLFPNQYEKVSSTELSRNSSEQPRMNFFPSQGVHASMPADTTTATTTTTHFRNLYISHARGNQVQRYEKMFDDREKNARALEQVNNYCVLSEQHINDAELATETMAKNTSSASSQNNDERSDFARIGGAAEPTKFSNRARQHAIVGGRISGNRSEQPLWTATPPPLTADDRHVEILEQLLGASDPRDASITNVDSDPHTAETPATCSDARDSSSQEVPPLDGLVRAGVQTRPLQVNKELDSDLVPKSDELGREAAPPPEVGKPPVSANTTIAVTSSGESNATADSRSGCGEPKISGTEADDVAMPATEIEESERPSESSESRERRADAADIEQFITEMKTEMKGVKGSVPEADGLRRRTQFKNESNSNARVTNALSIEAKYSPSSVRLGVTGEVGRTVSVDSGDGVLPASTRLRRQRRMNSLGPEDQPEDPLERLNRLRARISGALSEVKGVLKQYSTEADADNSEATEERVAKRAETVPDRVRNTESLPETEEPKPRDDDGPITFRFVKIIRRRSVFSEEDEDTEKDKMAEGRGSLGKEGQGKPDERDKEAPLNTEDTDKRLEDGKEKQTKEDSKRSREEKNEKLVKEDNDMQEKQKEKRLRDEKIKETPLTVDKDERIEDDKAKRVEDKRKQANEENKASRKEKNEEEITKVNQKHKDKLKHTEKDREKPIEDQKENLEKLVEEKNRNQFKDKRDAKYNNKTPHVNRQQAEGKEKQKKDQEKVDEEDKSVGRNRENKLECKEEKLTIKGEGRTGDEDKKVPLEDGPDKHVEEKQEKLEETAKRTQKQVREELVASDPVAKATDSRVSKPSNEKSISNDTKTSNENVYLEKVQQAEVRDLQPQNEVTRPSARPELFNGKPPISDMKVCIHVPEETNGKITQVRTEPTDRQTPQKATSVRMREKFPLPTAVDRRNSIAALEGSKIEPPIAPTIPLVVKTQRRPSDSEAILKKKDIAKIASETTPKVKTIKRVKRPSVKRTSNEAASTPEVTAKSTPTPANVTHERANFSRKDAATPTTLATLSVIDDASSTIAEAAATKDSALTKKSDREIGTMGAALISPPRPSDSNGRADTTVADSLAELVGETIIVRPADNITGAAEQRGGTGSVLSVLDKERESATVGDKTTADSLQHSPKVAIELADTSEGSEGKSLINQKDDLPEEPLNEQVKEIGFGEQQVPEPRTDQAVSLVDVTTTLSETNTTQATTSDEPLRGAEATKASDTASSTHSPEATSSSAISAAEAVATAAAAVMPELQVKAVQVFGEPKVPAPFNVSKDDSAKKKPLLRKLIRKNSTEKPQSNRKPVVAEKKISSQIRDTKDKIKNSSDSSVPSGDAVKPSSINESEGFVDAVEKFKTPTDDAPAEAEAVGETPAPAEKKKRRIKKKVIIKRQERKLSISDNFFKGPAEEPVTPNEEVLEKPVAYVEVDTDEEQDYEDIAPPARPAKGCLKVREFEVGDVVMYAERYKKTQVRWKKGTILDRITSISYKLEVEGKEVAAHISYIKKYHGRRVNFSGKEYLEIEYEQVVADEDEEAKEKRMRSYSIWNMV